MKVLVRGGGDLASAVIHKLWRSGFKVLVCDLALPSCVRRTVSFCNAISEGEWEIEGARATFVKELSAIDDCLARREIPVSTMPEKKLAEYFRPDVFVDATVSKRAADYDKNYAGLVIALGPNIMAGRDADVVVETKRGHYLGSLIYEGFAAPNTGIPGDVDGFTSDRVLRAPQAGRVQHIRAIGDTVDKGEAVCQVGDAVVSAAVPGVIRGLIAQGYEARQGLKIGDIDPRNDLRHCYSISDKGRTIAGGVLEAILFYLAAGDYLKIPGND
ncbi:MAG: EF2563 family selenium-dependent molybdenum hydroxylase system protein [Clostridiaceae bacterium]|jgi:xanthine dehydrogenase accessory factor|nr:EF2563 family selenium-dependent molybdenum hydroxylase system protein [Clostridiaceae bacterium]